MNTLATALAFSLVLAVAAGAQPQSSDAPPSAPMPPVNAPAKPAPGASQNTPSVLMPPVTAPPAKGSAAASPNNPFRTVDPAIKELGVESGEKLSSCLEAAEYLRADLASTQRRVKQRGGQVPGDQESLVAVKMKRFGKQQQACVDMTTQIGGHFDLVMRYLGSIEPRNHPGIPARRAKITAMREKFNAALKKMKSEGIGKPAASDGSADEGSEK